MMQQTSNQTGTALVSIARKGVFDRQRRLWGYELFCVGNTGETPSGVPAAADVPVTVAATAGVALQRLLTREKRFLVGLSEKNILDDQAYVLPPDHTTVFVGEETYRKGGVAARVAQLRADGFPVAVPDFTGAADCADLYGLADIIGVAVGDRPHGELAQALAAVRGHGAAPLACLVPDVERFAACHELGFELFQGAFSKVAEIVPLKKVSSSQVVRFNLLKAIETEEPDLAALAGKIQTDAAISFRLLTHLNSASFGLAHKVKSIPHAISLLGWRQIRNWLRVVLLSDVDQGDENSELLLLAAQRARFLELVARRTSFWGFDPESLHLLGLFSLLDAMIGVPMTEIVAFLPLDRGLKAALCGEPDSEYLPLITLAQTLEEARWPEAEAAIGRLNLDAAATRAAFQEAVVWAGELTAMVAQ